MNPHLAYFRAVHFLPVAMAHDDLFDRLRAVKDTVLVDKHRARIALNFVWGFIITFKDQETLTEGQKELVARLGTENIEVFGKVFMLERTTRLDWKKDGADDTVTLPAVYDNEDTKKWLRTAWPDGGFW